MAVRALVRAAQPLLARAPGGLRILCYHLVDGGTASPVDLPRGEFIRQVSGLRRKAHVVSLADGVQSVGRGSDKQLVAITFDDGFRNFYEGVWPILEEHQVPVTLFVPSGFIAATSPSPLGGVELPPCSWAQLRELVNNDLITIGSHSCTHPDLRALGREQLAAELRDSRARLEDELGVSVGSFCYPRALWNRRVEQQVMQAYNLAVIGGGRRITSSNLNPHRLWRTSVRRDSPLPVEKWLTSSLWLEEAAADVVRRLR